MVVLWSPNARSILKNIFDYYLEVASRKVAEKMVNKILMSAHALCTMPFMAPHERTLPGYRSIVVSKTFKVIYRVNEGKGIIEIVSIFDCRQNPAKLRQDVLKTRKK